MSRLFLLVALMPAAAGGVALVDVVVRRSSVGFGLVIAGVLTETLGVPIQGNVGPFQIYLSDVVFGLLGVAAVARLLRSERSHPLQWALLVLLLVTATAIAQGTGLFGPGAAINEARKYIHFTAAALYFSAMTPTARRRDTIAKGWLIMAGALGVIVLVRWVAFFTGVGAGIVGTSGSMRVIDSFDALIVLEAALIGFAVRSGELRAQGWHPRWRRLPLATGAFVGLLLLLQHRTLWIAFVLGIAALLLRRPEVTRRLVPVIVAGTLVTVGLVGAVLGQGGQQLILDDLSRSATDSATLDWRVEGWRALLVREAPEDAVDWMAGQPFGGGFPRYVEGRYVNVSPHNFFLELFLRVGVIGVLAFTSVHVISLTRLYRSRGGSTLLGDATLGTILLVQLIYYATSHPSAEQGVLLGLAVAVAMRHAPARTRHSATVAALRPSGPRQTT